MLKWLSDPLRVIDDKCSELGEGVRNAGIKVRGTLFSWTWHSTRHRLSCSPLSGSAHACCNSLVMGAAGDRSDGDPSDALLHPKAADIRDGASSSVTANHVPGGITAARYAPACRSVPKRVGFLANILHVWYFRC